MSGAWIFFGICFVFSIAGTYATEMAEEFYKEAKERLADENRLGRRKDGYVAK